MMFAPAQTNFPVCTSVEMFYRDRWYLSSFKSGGSDFVAIAR
jgi:hypothetical protein